MCIGAETFELSCKCIGAEVLTWCIGFACAGAELERMCRGVANV